MEMLAQLTSWLCQPLLPLVLVAACLLRAYLTSTYGYWRARGVPHPRPTVLLGNFGDLLLLRKSQCEGLRELCELFPGERYFGAFRVREPVLVLRDPELLRCVCARDFRLFCNRGVTVNPARDPLSGHLFNLEGNRWRSLRSKLTPAFTSVKLKRMFYLLAECSIGLARLIDRRLADPASEAVAAPPGFADDAAAAAAAERVSGRRGGAEGAPHRHRGLLEVRELAANFAIDVIGSCAFGIQINALSDEASGFRRAARSLAKPSYKATVWRMLRSALPRIYRLLGVQIIDPAVTNFFMDVVSKMIKERENEATKRHDFMDLLIELKNKGTLELDNSYGLEAPSEEIPVAEEIVLDEKTIAAQAFVFFVAGNETSSSTIAFCLYEMAINTEIQEKVRRELTDALKLRKGELTYEAVQNMKYLDMVIMETLRKYPPAPFVSRRCEAPYRIPGSELVLPKGMRVILPIYATHHDPQHYPDPSIFRPERFDEASRRTRHPYAFLPFGQGPRCCIGMRFALLETKVGVITFLSSYKLEICEKTDIPIKFSRRSLVTTSENGIWLKVSKFSDC